MTVAGTNEVLGAKWGEIDAENGVWRVPACRMKGGRAHRVPLSRRAAAILAELAKAKAGDFIFPGQQPGRHISSLEIIMARMKVDATVHGFRSSFSDWASETTNFPREVIEHAWLTLLVATSSGAIGAVISSKSAGLSYKLGAAFAICPIAAMWFRSRG
ncbi:MAG: Prophage CP4-57 integrase [Beijerinckiaceae bacterium]|nr:MAG: Prophage CP4-57 integrase [Beijerinckiaceae bacterium]